MDSIKLKIEGMSCASCAANIEKSMNHLDGVTSASVNYATEVGSFSFSDKKVIEKIKNTLTEQGYTYRDARLLGQGISDGHQGNLRKFVISITLSIIIFVLAMGPLTSWPNQNINWIIQMILATPIWVWIGYKFQRAALKFLTSGQSNMNTLIGIGTSAAFFYSSFITLFSDLSLNLGLTQTVYFEAVGFIVSFVYLGQHFEHMAKRKTKEALNSLLELGAKSALLHNGKEFVEVDISLVQVGGLLRVRPGEKIPVDGKIIKGESTFDEAMITGESMPVTKSVGEKLFAGTINGDKVVEYQATGVGGDTFLQQIVAFVEDAQNSKPGIQRYADKISGIFTPTVIAISIITFALWFFIGPEPVWGYSISNFIAVLVVACPCALGLATPTAVVVATGRASLAGVLIGGGEVIEMAVGVNAIVFDKTGTLTEGNPSVSDYLPADDFDLLQHVASIEQFSEHPISRSIVEFAKTKEIELTEPDSFEIVKGQGVLASIKGIDYIIGNRRLLVDRNIVIVEALVSNKIGSSVYISANGVHVGFLCIGDRLKAGAEDVISNFKKLGFKTWMITGDNEIVGNAIGKELEIDHIISESMPLDKSNHILDIQGRGYKVAMIGDGVNDAPALAVADLSIAMGTGTDVAINASDVTIVNGDIAKVIDFIKLANGSMRIIKQNLFLSLVYNSLLIPISAGLLYIFNGPLMPPVLASVAMALSSISVVLNSLRIRKLI